MTYEEYKNNKKETSGKSIFKTFMSKLFTIVIFTMLVVIISNYSPKFRDFVTNKVLNWYGNVKESVKLYDYIESGEVIGTADSEYYYVLLKDNKPINIDEN